MIVDLHVHSSYSNDSLARPASIVRAAKRKGLDGVAITDHDTMAGALEAREANRDPDFLLILGAEFRSQAGDIIGLFLHEEIETRDPVELVAEIHRQGAIAVLPHPARDHKLSNELIRMVDAIEVFNPRCSPSENRRARQLAVEHHKPMLAGSDAHTCRELGTAATIFPATDLRAAILAGEGELVCRYAPYYLESLSQLIKSLKTRHYHQVPVRALSVLARLLGLRRRASETD